MRGECQGAWKRAETAECDCCRFEINYLLFADDDTALVLTERREKLCRLVCEFGGVCETKKLRLNVGKSKVMRCSRYGNGCRMYRSLNGETLDKAD